MPPCIGSSEQQQQVNPEIVYHVGDRFVLSKAARKGYGHMRGKKLQLIDGIMEVTRCHGGVYHFKHVPTGTLMPEGVFADEMLPVKSRL